MMKFIIRMFFIFLIASSCSEPGSLQNMTTEDRLEQITAENFIETKSLPAGANSFTVTRPYKVKLTDSMAQSYIRFSKEMYKTDKKKLEQIQSLVPLNVSGYNDLILKSGFSDIKEFADANLVIAVCVNAILAAENTDRIQGKSKEDYVNDFTSDLDENDEFDRKFKEMAEAQINDDLKELEEQGLVGNKTTQMTRFVINDLKEKKAGAENTEIVLKHLTGLKENWVIRYQ